MPLFSTLEPQVLFPPHTQKLAMTTYIAIGLPPSNGVALVAVLSNITNNFNYRPMHGNGEYPIRSPKQYAELFA